MTDHDLSRRAAKLVAQVQEVAKGALPAGEQVLVAVRVNREGAVVATAAGAIGGAAGAVVAGKILEASGAEGEHADLFSDLQMALGLTDRSVVVTSRSSLSGKPKAFRGTIPLEHVEGVTHEPGRMGDELHLRLRSGTEVTFSCVKVDPGEVFAQALTERLGRS